MVTQLCELKPQHRTAVWVSPVTVGTLDNVRYLQQFGEYMLTESFAAHGPKLPFACPRSA